MWWTDSEPSPSWFAPVKFPEHVTLQTDNFFIGNKSRKQNNFSFLFFLKLITHKNDEEKKCLFCYNKMEMKHSPIRCTLKLSGHNQHLHHWNSVEREIFMYRTWTGGFQLSHGRASLAASHGWFWTLHSKTYATKPIKDLLGLKRKGQRSAAITGGGRGNAETWRGTCFDKLLEDELVLIWQVSLQCKASKTHQRNWWRTGALWPFGIRSF